MKKIVSFLLVCCFLTICPPKIEALSLSAKYACLMDAQTGQILFEKNGYSEHSMASTTKIMTALLAIENSSPQEIVTVSANAAGTEGSSLYLKSGEKITMGDLLYGLMLESGNDAAVAIAEHIGKSTDGFAKMMTDRAHEIGATQTAFKNPNGLDAEGHYTTACDLALITRHAMKNPVFSEIASTKRKTTDGASGATIRSFYNHNKLLSLYPGCTGVKTGFTKKTGRCLVSSATRDHVSLICVTLNAPDDWNDHKRLLDYGFSVQKAKPLIVKDMVLKSLPVKNGSSKTVELLAADDFFISQNDAEGLSKWRLDYMLPASVPAPVPEGAQIGKVKVFYEDELIKEIELSAAISIDYVEPPEPGFWEMFKKLWKIG